MSEKNFKKLHGFFIEDLEVGQEAILKKKITEDDIHQFSKITGDNNPVHVDEDFENPHQHEQGLSLIHI